MVSNLAAVIPYTANPIEFIAQSTGPRSMTDTALALSLPATMPLPDWRAFGDKLRSTRFTIDFLIGDWITHGRVHFPDQAEPVIADLFPDSREARRVEKVAKVFPAHLRNDALTFEHHAKVADMPVQEALPLLKRASDENLTPAQLRIQAMLRKVETGQVLPSEDDPEDDALLACVRAWNRAPRNVREEFAEMVADSHFGVIEP